MTNTNIAGRRFLKVIFGICASIITLMLLLAILLPTLASSNWTKTQLVNLVNQTIPGNIELNSLSINWFGPQEINEFVLKDPENQVLVSLQKGVINASLFSLLWNRQAAGNIEIVALNANIASDDGNVTNIQKSFDHSSLPLPPTNQAYTANVSLNDVQAKINLTSNASTSTLNISGKTSQDDVLGTFSIDAEISNQAIKRLMHHSEDLAATLQAAENALKVNVDIINFPVALFDQLFTSHSPHYAGVIKQLLGPKLNLTVKQVSNTDGITLKLEAQTATLTAQGDAHMTHDVAHATPLLFSFKLMPSSATQSSQKNANKSSAWLIDIAATIPKQTSGSMHLQDVWDQLSLQAKLANLPLALLDEYLSLGGQLTGALGQNGAMTVTMAPSAKGSALDVQWKSERLEIPNLSFQLGDQLVLRQPSSMNWQLTPEWINTLILRGSTKLQDASKATVVLQEFSIPSPLKESNGNIKEQLTLNGALAFETLRILPEHIGAVSINDLALHFSATPRSPLQLALSSNIVQTEPNGTIHKLLGENTKIEGTANLKLRNHPSTTIDDLRLNLVSDLAKMQVAGKIRDGNTLVLTAPATVAYMLTSPALNFLGMTTQGYSIEHKKPLTLLIAPSNIPLSFQNLSNLKISGALKADDLYITHNIGHKESHAVIDHLNVNWLVDSANAQLTLQFVADTRLEQEAAGKVNGTLSLSKWLNNATLDLQQAVIDATITAANLPVEILNVLTGNKNLLPLFGNSINVTTVIEYSPTSHRGSFLLDLQSPHIKANADFSIDQAIRLKDTQFPVVIALKLTPSGYTVLRQLLDTDYNGDFLLTEPANASLKINTLDIPLSSESTQLAALMNASFDVTLSIDHLSGVNNKTKQKVFLNSLQSQLTTKNLAKHVAFDMKAKGQNDQGIATSWNVAGAIDQALAPDGSVNADGLALTLDASIDSLPLVMLCQFVCVDHETLRQFEAVIGPTMNAKVKAQLQQMNGFLYIDLKGKNGNLLLDSTIANGIMQLNKDLEAHVTITPQLSEYVLQEFFPILDGMIDADQPLKLTIERQGFALPLKDPSPTTISVSKAKLDAGKVHVSSQSELAKVLSLLASGSNKQMVVWLTPLYFSISKGEVKIERVDILINERYPVAAWGKVDIPKDNVNMVIAISGASLIQAFNVPGISNSYFLQLPLRGTLNKAEIDKTKAAARISALVAQAKGGTQGAVIGTVLHIASGGLTEGAAPKPTTHPLPWEQMLQDSASNTSKSSEADASSKINSDSIKKGAGNLIKQLFR